MYIGCTLELIPREPAAGIFTAVLAELGFESFEDTETGLIAYIKEADFDEASLRQIPYWKSDAWQASYTLERIPVQNWNAVWEADYHPIQVSDLCVVRAPFHNPPEPPVTYDLVIAPKMSFGTGHHETTWLMLSALLEKTVSGKRVLDMGCGTGVLGILAHRMGAQQVIGIDIDAWSVENARENADRNQGESIEFRLGEADSIGEDHFDLILANINKNILLDQLPRYAKALEPGGVLLLSGFYPADIQDLTDAATALGLKHENTLQQGAWCALELSRSTHRS
ncbi:ribosomal protein L11 methyltransferase [Robiginitalea myxolifaciens]|uniref:Ribosomal protein L11 methyltransferase n=1 Tax=Robiginitalea myxolifaciens TaxID=400055 RepID=A0A1I6HDR7_9FLAO|nr:50S ribosomal protein L11 methyltransferase [Robiginitalea myxolifaciens]SFR52633.1 ribosomal protein L11 methyltransferase [Robiginitalea myxolifaciens]